MTLADCDLFGFSIVSESDDIHQRNRDKWGTATTADTKEESPDGNVSPFIKYLDGYRWPDLYTEIDEMIEPCILIFAFVELRRLVREGTIKSDKAKRLLKMPLTHSQVMSVVEDSRQALSETKFGKEHVVEILKAAEERHMIEGTVVQVENGETKKVQPVRLSASNIVAIDDEYEKEELVYMVEVDHKRRRVTVCFRGSVTKMDWATNFEIYMKDVPNPMKKSHDASQQSTIRVHNGFHDYLLEPSHSRRGAKGLNGEDISEYKEILQQHVLPLLRKYPRYKLYVTGHSLGAALATLFGFEVAAEPDDVIPKPVTLITFGGPYVGDSSFRQANRLLEGLGKLRHVRVSNHKDLVTLIPKMAFKWNVFDSNAHVGSLFKHVGMNLRLMEGSKTFDIRYPRVTGGKFSSTIDEMSRGWDQALLTNLSWNPVQYWTWPFHSLREYNKRLDANKPSLQTVYVNELYSRKDVVGLLVPQF